MCYVLTFRFLEAAVENIQSAKICSIFRWHVKVLAFACLVNEFSFRIHLTF